jgi:hypothetical protein
MVRSHHALALLIAWCIAGTSVSAGDNETRQRSRAMQSVHKLEELTWPQIDAFDRDRTLFILPVGMIEGMDHISLWAPTRSACCSR